MLPYMLLPLNLLSLYMYLFYHYLSLLLLSVLPEADEEVFTGSGLERLTVSSGSPPRQPVSEIVSTPVKRSADSFFNLFMNSPPTKNIIYDLYNRKIRMVFFY